MIVRNMKWMLLLSLLLVSGCTQQAEIQDNAYATAIGIDYKDGMWIAYAQVLNFSSIAHSQQLEIGKPVPVWIGKGEGKSLAYALSNINRSSQYPLFWGHVKVLIMTESVLKRGVTDVFSAINRYREVRYNILIYGTKRKIEDILTQKSNLNMSPLSTVMFTAAQSTSALSALRPLTTYRLIADLNEPGEPAMLPSIDSDRKTWKEDKKPKDLPYISGGYFFHKNKMIGWMSEKDLRGIRWADQRLEKTTLQFPSTGSAIADMMFNYPELSIIPHIEQGKAVFDLHIVAYGHVIELLENADLIELKRDAAEVIRKEIVDTYRKGILIKGDPYKLKQALYRSYPSEFRRLSNGNEFFLTNDSLREVKVRVRIKNMGKYKGQRP